MGELERILREGAALHDSGQYDEALNLYDEAVGRWPTLALLWNNRGNTLLEMGFFDQAAKSYQQALLLAPTLHDSRVALATCLQAQGKLHEALVECAKVLRAAPDHAEAHWNYSLLLLLQGNYAAGFREYEWRWKKRRFTSPVRAFTEPRWNGGPLTGQTMLVYAEQGLGDTIQFCRYLPLLVERGAQVLFECHHPLKALMQTLGNGITVLAFGDPLPFFDCQAPLLSLPFLMNSTQETIPCDVPYLASPTEHLPFWQSVMPPRSGRRIGLCWSGKSYPDPGRSCPPELLVPLGSVAGAAYVSLQIGCEGIKPPVALMDLTMLVQDFADTAALMTQLDLVITIDTAVAHLAGALGKETWVLVPFAPDWRWGLERQDCLWYPTVRIFRQHEPGNWEAVVQEVALALSSR